MKYKWTKCDDDLLKSIYDDNKSWPILTKEFNLKSNNIKNPKQLQQRWSYFLNPEIFLIPITLEEINIIKYNFIFNKTFNNKRVRDEIYLKTGIKRTTHFVKNNLIKIKNKSKKNIFTINEDINLYYICKDNEFLWTKVHKDFNKKFKHYKDIFDLKYRWFNFLKKYTTPDIFTLDEDIKLYNICIDDNINWNQIFNIFSEHYPKKKTKNDLIYRWHLYLDPEKNPIYTN